ncbi:22977_t:CDS:2, partial [Entrophospora sp. SA101]
TSGFTNQYPIIPQGIENLAENNEICVECKNLNTSVNWCNNCDAEKLASSGNVIIDDFIKNNAKRTNSYKDYWEWIPHERFEDVKNVNEGDSRNLFVATWLDGEKVLNYQNDTITKDRSGPISVTLFIIDETNLPNLIKNVKIIYNRCFQDISFPKIYGLSFLPIMQKYVYVIQYSRAFYTLEVDQLLRVKVNQSQKISDRIVHQVHHQINYTVDYFCEIIPGSETYFPGICMTSLPDFKKLVDLQVETQNELIKHNSRFGSSSNGPLINQIKEVELAGRDLLTVVEYSKLNSAPILAGHLKDFVDWSYTINKNLQKLQAQTQASLSSAILYIKYTLSKLEDMRGKILTPRHLKDIDKIFYQLIHNTDDNLRKLIILTNDVSSGVLSLQAIQSNIASTVEKEKGANEDDKSDKVFSDAWRFFGYQVDTMIFDKNLKLLEKFDNNKGLIVESITEIRDQLNLFEAHLNILRSGTNKPLLVDIPFELHLASMKNALLELSRSTVTG